jgi:hypothetical protein
MCETVLLVNHFVISCQQATRSSSRANEWS